MPRKWAVAPGYPRNRDSNPRSGAHEPGRSALVEGGDAFAGVSGFPERQVAAFLERKTRRQWTVQSKIDAPLDLANGQGRECRQLGGQSMRDAVEVLRFGGQSDQSDALGLIR